MGLSYAPYLEKIEVTEAIRGPKVANCFDPLEDPRWDRFLQWHPRASVFHSSAWLQALSRTYGYQPVAYTTSSPAEELENAIVFCRVESWLTGRRLVSLPFSDHCEPLVDSEPDLEVLSAILGQEMQREQWRYIEMRPLNGHEIATPLHRSTITYSFHQLDLRPDLGTIFRGFHKNSTQRKVRRAEREGLVYDEGTSDEFIDHFYKLFVVTRKRHRLPSQPRQWFANLVECFGKDLKIRVVFHHGRAVAAMLTIRHKDTLVYKYGCSDPRFNKMGSMHLLFWTVIQEAKASGLRRLDFGRTDAGQDGLTTFKKRWGAVESVLTYSRFGQSEKSTHLFDLPATQWKTKAAKSVLAILPSGVLARVGTFLYRHVG
jgi:CelD/BcsL family acetyltransferase involved in cellulose biosynthesis